MRLCGATWPRWLPSVARVALFSKHQKNLKKLADSSPRPPPAIGSSRFQDTKSFRDAKRPKLSVDASSSIFASANSHHECSWSFAMVGKPTARTLRCVTNVLPAVSNVAAAVVEVHPAVVTSEPKSVHCVVFTSFTNNANGLHCSLASVLVIFKALLDGLVHFCGGLFCVWNRQ